MSLIVHVMGWRENMTMSQGPVTDCQLAMARMVNPSIGDNWRHKIVPLVTSARVISATKQGQMLVAKGLRHEQTQDEMVQPNALDQGSGSVAGVTLCWITCKGR